MLKYSVFILLLSITSSVFTMQQSFERLYDDARKVGIDLKNLAGEVANKVPELLEEGQTQLTINTPRYRTSLRTFMRRNNQVNFSIIRSSLGLACSIITLLVGLGYLFDKKGRTIHGLSATLLGSAGCYAMGYNLQQDIHKIR